MPEAVRSTCSARSTRRIRRSGGTSEPQQDLVVAEREPVVGRELSVQVPRRVRVRTQQRTRRHRTPEDCSLNT